MKQKLKRFMAGFMAMLTLVGTLFTNGSTAFAASPQANIAFWNASVKNSGEVSELKPGYNHGKILYSILDGNSAYCMNFGLRADGGQLMNSYDDASTSMSAQQRKGIAFIKSRRAELNVVQMVENMRDQALSNGVIINDAYCDRSMTRDYDREALNAFFATLKEEDFEVVVVRSLNDITDDIYDLEEFVKTITDMGIWLYSLEVGPVPITASHAEDFGC